MNKSIVLCKYINMYTYTYVYVYIQTTHIWYINKIIILYILYIFVTILAYFMSREYVWSLFFYTEWGQSSHDQMDIPISWQAFVLHVCDYSPYKLDLSLFLTFWMHEVPTTLSVLTSVLLLCQFKYRFSTLCCIVFFCVFAHLVNFHTWQALRILPF